MSGWSYPHWATFHALRVGARATGALQPSQLESTLKALDNNRKNLLHTFLCIHVQAALAILCCNIPCRISFDFDTVNKVEDLSTSKCHIKDCCGVTRNEVLSLMHEL